MGCIQSKNEHKNGLFLCKERKKLMEQAIASWEAMSTACSAYGLALKNVGAALTDYCQGIVENNIHCVTTPISAIPALNIPTSPHFLCSPIPEIEEESLMIDEDTDSTPLIGNNQEAYAQENPEHAEASGGSHVKVVVEIMNDLDRHFLEASESIQLVSEILEAPHIGYDTRTDYAARVMRAITWNSSSGGVSDVCCEVHTSVLEWEDRLYKELKALEPLKSEYEKKAAFSKTKRNAAVRQFHTRYVVGRESVDSVIAEINRLRDEVLYQMLLNLIDGMAKMWESMREHHENQLKIVADRLRVELAILISPMVTSQQHCERTNLLWQFLKDWRSQFQKLAVHKKQYVEALNGWSGLAQQQTEGSLQPIRNVLEAWREEMEKDPYEHGIRAIDGFSDVISAIMGHQEEELTLRKKCEETGEMESNEEVCRLMREKSVMSLTIQLEELFRSMSEFALASSEMYKKLRSSSGSKT